MCIRDSANAVAANGAAVFVNVGWLALAVLLGSAIQLLVVHSLLLRFVARLPVLPLGASIGKDGTAMYVGLLSMFALQAFGAPLTPSVYALVLMIGALAAFGTAPVPSASLFMLAAVLSAVGIAPEQTALVVGFVLPFDRLLDMTRTVPSASANLAVTTAVARLEGELDEEVYRARPEA